MAKMMIIYRTPADPDVFDRHYFSVHVPLAKRLPGLRRYDISRGPITILSPGDTPYMIATLHFDDIATIRDAFASEVGQACAADRRKFAPNDEDCTMLLFEDEPV